MDLEALLLETLSKDQLEEQVAEKIAHFHGLLTREVAIRLIAKEKGVLKDEERKVRLSGVAKGMRKLVIEARVKKIWPLAEYRSGKRSRVIEIEDGTGSMPLVLWNDDVKLATKLRTHDTVLVKGAYERNNELHLGYSGTVKVVGRMPFSDLSDLASGQYAHLKGYVSRIDGFDRFVDGKSAAFGFSFFISDGKAEVQAVIWGKPGRGRALEKGDEIILENALEKKGRLELSADARIMIRRKESMLLGDVERLEVEGDVLKVKVGQKEVGLDRENALRFLGVKLADDIELSTAANLKKAHILNNFVAVRIKEEEGRVVVER